jgi:hypothetical protein
MTAKKVKATGRQMHVFKVVSRVKVAGERRYPYRVLGLPEGADLRGLAEAIVSAFGFDFDHAFGFFDTTNPYRANVAYELFRDLEGGPASAPGILPDEADLALLLGMEALDKLALLRETAEFLARRLEEELLPRLPERLHEPVRAKLRDFTADLLDVEELEKAQAEDSLPLPPEARELLGQPGGLEQLLGMFQAVQAAPGAFGGPSREEHGVSGVPVTVPFGRQPKWTFLFDYGDDWTFDVTSQGVQEAPPRVRLPRVLDSLGTAPEQYPEWEE